VSREAEGIFLSRDVKMNEYIVTRFSIIRLTSCELRHVPQIVLIFDVLFLFRLKAIALQHRINRRRCHYYPFDRISIASAQATVRGGGVARYYIAIRPRFDYHRIESTCLRASRRAFKIVDTFKLRSTCFKAFFQC